MPELPDVTVYVEALEQRLVGQEFTGYAILSPFILRTVDPPLDALVGRSVVAIERLGKRIAIEVEDELFIVIHLMIAGRFRWFGVSERRKVPARIALAEFQFASGTLVLTEAGTKRRASLHVVRGREALRQFDRGGLEVLDATRAQFAERLSRENHTLKRSLTDPRLFSGIGNAYSDEILHRARLSPLKLTSRLSDEEIARLFDATRETLVEWTERMRADRGDGFPEKVTAFRDGMAVHGRYKEPCPVCTTPIQRIRYKDNETNYCARCQTEGRLLADRGLSRLLKQDWPKTIEELEG
jgi:formamidopyrimidine-DNA glycosylase